MREEYLDDPITEASQDLLDRGSFVRRIANSLVTESGVATGVSLGLTGKWGAGKTSILNLLEQELQTKHKNIVVVRFDPWLVSQRDSSISAFFQQLVFDLHLKIGKSKIFNNRHDQVANELIDAILRYGALVSPLFDVVLPGSSPIVAALSSALDTFTEEGRRRIADLHNIRSEIEGRLDLLDVPIIVFIDELDRTEDSEVRVMAQLVRSVANFSKFSYVISFDETRVSEVLGASESLNIPALSTDQVEKVRKRGREYLQKIVPVQLALPHIQPNKIIEILIKSLDGLLNRYGQSNSVWSNQRFEKFIQLAVPDAISSLRDVKSLMSVFEIRYPMVHGEVSWIDVVSYCLLERKQPDLTVCIAERIEGITFNGRPENVDNSFTWSSPEGNFENLFGGLRFEPWALKVFEEMFPAVSRSRAIDDCSGDDVAFRRPLITLVTLSLPSGSVGKNDLQKFITSSSDDQFAELEQRLSHKTAEALLDRVFETAKSGEPISVETYQKILTSIDTDTIDQKALEEVHYRKNVLRDVVDSIFQLYNLNYLSRSDFYDLVESLLNSGSVSAATSIVYRDFFRSGTYGKERRKLGEPIFVGDIQLYIVTKLGVRLGEIIDNTDSGEFPQFSDIAVLYFLNATERWTEQRKQKLVRAYLLREEFLDYLICQMFGGNYSVMGDTFEIFGGMSNLYPKAQFRMSRDDFSTLPVFVRNAYDHFAQIANF